MFETTQGFHGSHISKKTFLETTFYGADFFP
jgi:hypothetical protein